MAVHDITIDNNSILVIGDYKISIDYSRGTYPVRVGIAAPKNVNIMRSEILTGKKFEDCKKAEREIKNSLRPTWDRPTQKQIKRERLTLSRGRK